MHKFNGSEKCFTRQTWQTDCGPQKLIYEPHIAGGFPKGNLIEQENLKQK